MPRTAPQARHLLWNDVGAQQRDCLDELTAAWEAVTASTSYVDGPFVDRFEADWADRCDRSHAVGVGNAGDAAALAFVALDVRPGDEIVVPANAPESTAAAVAAVGAVPVFVDVHPDTLLARPDLTEAAVGPRTVGVVVVDLYGQPVDVPAFEALTDRHDLFLLEDATHAPGARWLDRPTGSFGDVAIFGFPPDSNLGALGEAGILLTDDDDLARKVRRRARRADRTADDPVRVGGEVRLESRLDALQAAMLSTKLPWLDTWNAARRALAGRYRERLADTPARLVTEAADAFGVHRVAAVRTPRRDDVRAALTEAGIETRIPWSTPCHLLAPFAAQRRERLPVSEDAAGQLLALPLHPHLRDDDVDRVCAALLEAIARARVAA